MANRHSKRHPARPTNKPAKLRPEQVNAKREQMRCVGEAIEALEAATAMLHTIWQHANTLESNSERIDKPAAYATVAEAAAAHIDRADSLLFEQKIPGTHEALYGPWSVARLVAFALRARPGIRIAAEDAVVTNPEGWAAKAALAGIAEVTRILIDRRHALIDEGLAHNAALVRERRATKGGAS